MQFRSVLRISACLAVLALLLGVSPSTMTAQTADSEEISSLLSEAQHHAMLLDDDAATLQSYARSGLAWQTHAKQLESMKTHVNNLGKVTKQLSDLQSEGSPWQQEAIRQINPLLQDMADHLTATIHHLNDNQNKVNLPAYRDYVNGNYELASKTYETIKDMVAYDQAKSQAEALEQKLQIVPPEQGQSEGK